MYPGKRVEVLFTYSDALMENADKTSEHAELLGKKAGNSTPDVGKDGGAE